MVQINIIFFTLSEFVFDNHEQLVEVFFLKCDEEFYEIPKI